MLPAFFPVAAGAYPKGPVLPGKLLKVKRVVYLLNNQVMEIFIANLPHRINGEELIRWFTQFGRVQSARIISGNDGRSKGFGFVEIAGDTAAQRAIDVLNGTEVDGREVIVRPADHRPPARQVHHRVRRKPVLVASSAGVIPARV
jgi:RNA recognition motif-containing protein